MRLVSAIMVEDKPALIQPWESSFANVLSQGNIIIQKTGGIVMIQLIVGSVIGFFLSSVLWMVSFCVWYERQNPQAIIRQLREDNMYEVEQ